MRLHTGVISLVLMSLALGACASDETSTSTTTTTASTPLTAQQLSRVLLTTSDLGSGWTETQRDVFSTRQPENPSIDPSLWCPAGQGDKLATLAGQEGADVELTLGTTHSPYMVRQQAWTNADVQQYFTSVKSAVTVCTGVTWKDSERNSYTLQPLTGPTLGDESISWTVTIQLIGTTPMTFFSQQTAARFGTVMMVLQGSATPTTGASATAPNYVTIVRGAGNKMAALATS
ncbi:MAG: hypothetical protein ACXV5U_03785 [Ilumatobacteraceae bacterium]